MKLRLVPFSVLLLLTAFSIGAHAVAPAAAPSPAGKGTEEVFQMRPGPPGLPNFGKVSDGLYRGAQPTAYGYKMLERLGVKTIVNLRGFDSDKGAIEGHGFRYFIIPMSPYTPKASEVAAFLKVVTAPENQPVFVHCHYGADRTGLAVASYRMCVQGWDRAKALAEMPRYDFHEKWVGIRRLLETVDPVDLRKESERAAAPAGRTIH